MVVLATLLAALALTGVQLLPRQLGRLQGHRRGRWLSVAGGVAVAFVFLRLVPELVERRDAVADSLGGVLFFPSDVHEFALIGLLLFYGIEVLARRSGDRRGTRASLPDQVAIGMFALYYALIGDFLWYQAERGLGVLALYTLVMGLHFLVVDFGLREHHRDAYVHRGRWVLGAAVLLGWAIGGVYPLPEALEGVLLALLAGAVALVALKEELPVERQSHFGWFVAGALGYALLLAAL